jgi:hypothetical protein
MRKRKWSQAQRVKFSKTMEGKKPLPTGEYLYVKGKLYRRVSGATVDRLMKKFVLQMSLGEE